MIQDTAVLQDAYRREHRSLLQYAREASPYTSVADRPLRDGIMQIANEEASELQALGERMESHGVAIPYLGSYPVEFTDLNFVAVRHLLTKLIAEQKSDIARLEAAIPACRDVVSVAAVQHLVDLHKRHLNELKTLA